MSSFCKGSYSQSFSKNIIIYAIFTERTFNDSLTNDIVSFEQLGPELQRRICTFGYVRPVKIQISLRSLISIFTGYILDSPGCKVSSCRQRKLLSDCADEQADLSIRCAHMSKGTFFLLKFYRGPINENSNDPACESDAI